MATEAHPGQAHDVYSAHAWNVGEAITMARMNTLENGLAYESQCNAYQDDLLATIRQLAQDAYGLAQDAYTHISDDAITQQLNQGTQAWTYVKAAMIYNGNDVSVSLDGRFDNIEEILNGGNGQAGLITTVSGLSTVITNTYDYYHKNSLLEVIQDLYSKISINGANITDLQNAGQPYDSLLLRLNAEDAAINEVTTEVTNARSSNTWSTNLGPTVYPKLDDRLEADEGKIKAIETELNGAHSSESRKTENNGVNKPYDNINARFKEIEDEIVAAHYSTALNKTTQNTRYTSIDERFEAIESELKGEYEMSSRLDGFDTSISNINGNISTLSGRTTTLESQMGSGVGSLTSGNDETQKTVGTQLANIRNSIGTNDTSGLKGRIKVLEDEVGPANASRIDDAITRIGSLESEVDMASADGSRRIDLVENRLGAIDNGTNTMISGMNGKINKIAGELGMLSQSDSTTNTRIDTLANNLDTAENDIDALETTVGDNDSGLVKDVNTLKGQVNNATTGLAATKAIADEALTKANAAAVASTVNSALETINGNITSLQSNKADLSYVNTQLATKANSSDMTTALAGKASTDDLSALTTRVTALEGNTIIINTPSSGSNYTNDEPNSTAVPTPSENADYLIADDDGKYFYWRYINNNWELISGAGSGNGSSSGVILSTLPTVAEGDPNIDYFVGTNATGYTHYRFVAGVQEGTGEYITILPDNLISNLSVNTVEIKNNESAANEWPTEGTTHVSGGLSAYTYGDNNQATNLLSDFVAVRNARINATYEADGETLKTQTLQVLDTNGNIMEYPIVGGSGGGSVYTVRIETTTPLARSIPANSTDPVTIVAKVVMKQGNELVAGATATGYIQYRVNGTNTWNNGDRIEVAAAEASLRYTIQNDTYFTVDVTKYLQVDKTMQLRLVIDAHPENEEDTVSRYQTFTVSKVNISIADEAFDYASVKSSNFQFNYRCFGSGITKTVHFLMDGVDIEPPFTTTSHDTVLPQIIHMDQQSNGMHTFQVYFVTNTGLESNRLNYFILYNTDNTREAPLIGAAAENTSIVDGDEIIVNYSVSTPNSETTETVEIELYTLDEHNIKNSISTTILNDVTNNILASPPYRTFDYPSLKKNNPSDPTPDPITVYIKLTATHNNLSDTQTVSVQVRYLETSYDLIPESNNLLFSYSAYGRSNNNAGKETYTYTYTKVSGEEINFTGTFNNFNWATDGYKDGESLIIAGGATLDINVPIFNSAFNGINIEENDTIDKITTNGRTIEIDYEVLSTTNLNATIIDCMTTGNNPKGFRVTPQNCYLLNSGSNIDIDETGFIKNEESVAAAYLNPSARNHITFVIEPLATTLAADNTYHQSVNIYINGEFANACPYNTVGNDFDNNATITIGSDTCLIKLYSIRLYNRGLSEAKVLHNYAVAPVATRDKLSRLEDNDVLNAQGLVDYEKARRKYTCLLLTGMGTVNGQVVPTMAPYKGYPSVVGRIKDNEVVGKTESGLLLTKPTTENSDGYSVEFDLQDKLIDHNNLYGYASSNNVQGTSSQKFPIKNLKVYLAKGDDENVMVFDTNVDISEKKVYKYSINTAAAAAYKSIYGNDATLPSYITNCGSNIATIVKGLKDVPTQAEVVAQIEEYLNNEDAAVGAVYSTYSTGDELIVHPIKAYKKSKKVKYALKEAGLGESTLCWKADYMSTDHANTFNANIANTLYGTEDRLSDRWTDQTQFTVYGIKCLLFQQSGDGTPEFVGDGCLNNDKGNHATFGLETKSIAGVWPGDSDADTMCQKWDFRNNTGSLLYFKHDGLFENIDGKPAISRELECIYPDEGDLADIGISPNYNHFQILSSWMGNRANYWYEADATKRAAKKQIFIDEFRNHFNFNHILIYYLFMEYTALCDNRVKNIHMRTDNAGLEVIKDINGNTLLDGNSNPNSGPWTLAENLETRTMQEPIMDENGDYQFDQSGNMVLGSVSHVFVKDSVINNIDWQQGEGHSNFAIWAPVLYDLDSCFSADNVGYLKIRYDADWDYSLYNKLKFAGFDSILWLQVEDCFQDELKVMAKRLYNRVVGLNYSTFYRQQITDNLASLCPAITNQDMILKYDKPWTEGFLDYSQDLVNPPVSTDKYKYLQRGTRTGQKAIFMKQRSLFLASKYDGNEFIQDKITFRAGTQVNYESSVLTLVANQKIYPGAQFGDVNDVVKVTRRAHEMYDAENETWVPVTEGWVPEFTPCHIQHSGNMNNTDGIEIYGASVLNDIGDISRFHPWQVKVGNAINLKKLILGSSAPGYSNTSTDDIDGINACVLLEEINVCNLKNLTSLQLSNNGFIKKVYATGSGLNTLALPRGGVLDTIAYGANTTDITIINQSRLTNFSYENSNINNYANVTRLWIENTPNVPIKDIIMARLTPLESGDNGLRVGGLRIIGLDIDLNDDPTFLQVITSDLAKGSRLTSTGSHIEGSNTYPEITGKVHITSIRASLLAKVNELYPNLIVYNTINAQGEPINNIITEYSVTYKNYDGTVLYTDYRVSGEHYIDPAYDVNPITNDLYLITICPPDGLPKKPSDAQYIYRFGTYDSQNKYQRFSGWLLNGNAITADSTVNGTTILIATYPTIETQIYRVTWYDEFNGTQLKSIEAAYGDDLSSEVSPADNGTLTRIRTEGNNIKVFKGWSGPVGKITGNVNVYGLWQTSTINEDTPSITMETLTAADLYAVSRLSAGKKASLLRNKLGTSVMIPMGYDYEYTDGAVTTNLLGNETELVFNGVTNDALVYNNLTPLSTNSDWTFAIDYKFLTSGSDMFNGGTEFVLASCYKNANSSVSGFKLSLLRQNDQSVHKIQVTWGNSSVDIDYAITEAGASNALYLTSYRNVVVLSHNANEPNKLRVSYVLPENNGSSYGSYVTNTILTWNNNTLIDTPIILGGNYSGSTTTIENEPTTRKPAKGIIYWAKFWNADLGESNCSNLAAWTHESVPFFITGYNGAGVGKLTEQIYSNSELSFAASQGIGDRYYYAPKTGEEDSNEYFGWHQSRKRAICNNVIYRGMPEVYKSIIQQTTIQSAIRKFTQNLTYSYSTTSDYLYLGSIREIKTDAGGNYTFEVNNSWTSPWSWMVTGDNALHIIGYVQGYTTTVEEKSVDSDKYYLYRFSGANLKSDARIWTITSDPATVSNIRIRKSDNSTEPISLRAGDIWINNEIAYMYFTTEQINAGTHVDILTTGGGWKTADMWDLRTFGTQSQSAAENGFMRIANTGIVDTGAMNSTATSQTRRVLCPEFTI